MSSILQKEEFHTQYTGESLKWAGMHFSAKKEAANQITYKNIKLINYINKLERNLPQNKNQ